MPEVKKKTHEIFYHNTHLAINSAKTKNGEVKTTTEFSADTSANSSHRRNLQSSVNFLIQPHDKHSS